MAIFAVMLGEPNPQIIERIDERYPENYELSPTLIVLSSKDTPEQIAFRIGIKKDKRTKDEDVSGVVFRLMHSYAGYSYGSFWDWIEQYEDDF